MPIVRTYACPECNTFLQVTLEGDQWENGPPSCPGCDAREMQQEFRPVAIAGSLKVRARDMADNIIANDYHVANYEHEHRAEGTPKVKYKDQGPPPDSAWGANQAALEQAVAIGRETRLKYGNILDVIKKQPDLIAESKKRSPRIW